MGIFSRLIGNSNNPLSSFTIGFPEAEGESGNQINIVDVFEDFLGITNELANGKFIVSGRKAVVNLQLQNTY